jgi:hypothetical protein
MFSSKIPSSFQAQPYACEQTGTLTAQSYRLSANKFRFKKSGQQEIAGLITDGVQKYLIIAS